MTHKHVSSHTYPSGDKYVHTYTHEHDQTYPHPHECPAYIPGTYFKAVGPLTDQQHTMEKKEMGTQFKE